MSKTIFLYQLLYGLVIGVIINSYLNNTYNQLTVPIQTMYVDCRLQPLNKEPWLQFPIKLHSFLQKY